MIKLWRAVYYWFYSRYLIKQYAGYQRPKFEDRDTLERIIFPYLLSNYNPQTILDIGREDYQEFYNLFFKNKILWTIDKDPSQKEFGAKNHIIDDVANLRKHFKSNYFDLIIMNGVFGWGLNNKQKIEKTFSAIYDILKPNGILILGWNNLDDLRPMALNKIKALSQLKKFYFKPLKTDSFRCKGKGHHTYNFYIK